MIEVVSYKKEHMKELLKQPQNSYLLPFTTESVMDATEKFGYAQCVLEKGTNKVLACGGVADYWPGRGECWVVFSDSWTKYSKSITKVAKKLFENYPGKRIEAAVALNFKDGHRWIRLLGFQLDAPCLEGYLPGGEAASLYSRVK